MDGGDGAEDWSQGHWFGNPRRAVPCRGWQRQYEVTLRLTRLASSSSNKGFSKIGRGHRTWCARIGRRNPWRYPPGCCGNSWQILGAPLVAPPVVRARRPELEAP